jgi:deoxycytidylate deaminase
MSAIITAPPEKLPDNDTYYMGIALAVREKANCTGNRVGAVAVLKNRVISTGYNGVPEGMKNCLEGGCLRCQNPNGQFPSGTGYDLCICVHAEQNSLLSAARFASSQDRENCLSAPVVPFRFRSADGQSKEERARQASSWCRYEAVVD